MNKKNSYLLPITIVGAMFFAIGFALGINGYLIPYLREVLHLSSAESYMVLTATFSAFVLFGYPSGIIIRKTGYKKAMALSFLFFAIGLYLYIPSGHLESLTLFLVASFISGLGNTLLQAAVNPYVTICGPIESATQRMCAMGIANKFAWAIAPVFLSLFIDLTQTTVNLNDLSLPFYIITGIFILLGILSLIAPLPEVKAAGEDEDENTAVDNSFTARKTSVFQFPHVILGAIALFGYVGIETIALASPVDLAASMGFPHPQFYTFYTAIGMSIGYILGIILIPNYISQIKALYLSAILGALCSLLTVVAPPHLSFYCIAAMGLANSAMWGAVWALAIDKLGKFTKTGSSILVMAIVGGAIIPLCFGWLTDLFNSLQKAYWIGVPVYLYILWYAMYGHKTGLAAENQNHN
jgi:glucose/galactose transporter